MILLTALLIFFIGHKIPLWLTGKKMQDVRAEGGLKQILFELSGLFFIFLIAFIINMVIGITTKERYLLNENIVYGLNFSQPAKALGFEDGDKIVSINGEKVIVFDKILSHILSEYGDIKIGISRNDSDTAIVLMDLELYRLFIDGEQPFTPILTEDTIYNLGNDLIYSERERDLGEAISFFTMSVEYVYKLIFPVDGEEGVEYVIIDVFNLQGLIYKTSLGLIFLGFLNLLPLPGLNLGNAIIALIEIKRSKKFNPKMMNWLRYAGVGVISLLLIINIVYMY
jgi:membrane-associated protease RseP (regulator of RpoE activity)